MSQASPRRSRRRRRDIVAVTRILLLAMAAITPAVFDLGSVKPFDVVKVTTVWFFALLATGTFGAGILLGRTRPRRFTMAWLAGAYLLVAAVGTVLSRTRMTSLFGWYGRYGGFVTVLAYVLVFYVLACIYRDRPDRVHEVIYAMAVGAIVITTYIWIQRLGIDPIRWAKPSGAEPGQPYFGTMGNANFAGGYLGLTAPWLYLAFRTARVRWKRIAIIAWALIELAALWFTSARNGMLALAAAVAMLLIIHRRRVPLIVRFGAVGVAIGAVVLAVVVIWHPGSKHPPEPFRGVDVLRSTTVEARAYWWLAGMKMFAARPVIGWGPETFVTEHHKYIPRAAAAVDDSETADKPHNVFVEHAAHGGILGLGAYLALLFFAFKRGFARLRVATGNERHLVTALLALLAGYVGQAFFSIDVSAIGLVGWLVLGSIAALADPPDRTPAETEPARPPRRRVAAAVAVLVAMALAAVSTMPLKADHEARTAQRQASADEWVDGVIAHHDNSIWWHPYEATYRGLAGHYLEQQALKPDITKEEKIDLLDRALERYDEMDALQPGYHVWKLSIAKALGLRAAVEGSGYDDADEMYAVAEELSPYDIRIPTWRGDTHRLWAQVTKDDDRSQEFYCMAKADYEEAIALRKIFKAAWLGLGKTLAALGDRPGAIRALTRALNFEREDRFKQGLRDEIAKVEESQRTKKNTKPVSCD